MTLRHSRSKPAQGSVQIHRSVEDFLSQWVRAVSLLFINVERGAEASEAVIGWAGSGHHLTRPDDWRDFRATLAELSDLGSLPVVVRVPSHATKQPSRPTEVEVPPSHGEKPFSNTLASQVAEILGRAGASAIEMPTGPSVAWFSDAAYAIEGVTAVYHRSASDEDAVVVRTVLSRDDYELRATVYEVEGETYDRFPDVRLDFLVVTDPSQSGVVPTHLAGQGFHLLSRKRVDASRSRIRRARKS